MKFRTNVLMMTIDELLEQGTWRLV